MKKMIKIKNPILIKNKNFKTNVIKFCFPIEIKKENYLLDIALKNILSLCNYNHKSKREFERELIIHYIFSYYVMLIDYNTTGYFEFTLEIAKEKITPSYYENALDFFLDTLYNPFIEDNYEELKIGKARFHSRIKEQEKSIDFKSNYEFMSLINKKYYSLIDFKNEIDKLTNKQVYDYYKKVILNNKPIIIVFGDSPTTLFNLIKSKLGNKYATNIVINTDYYDIIKPTKLKEKEVSDNYNKSILCINYLIKDYTENDIYVLEIIYALLNNSVSDILYKILRQEYNLVYSCNCYVSRTMGCVHIFATIDKNNKDICLEAIKKCINLLKDSNYIKKNLKRLKEKYVDNFKTYYDSKEQIIIDKLSTIINARKSEKDFVKELLKITEKDIKKFVERFCLDTIYFARGEK